MVRKWVRLCRHNALILDYLETGNVPCGTRSMAHIVQKYGGMLRFKQEGDTFVTQIVLPLTE